MEEIQPWFPYPSPQFPPPSSGPGSGPGGGGDGFGGGFGGNGDNDDDKEYIAKFGNTCPSCPAGTGDFCANQSNSGVQTQACPVAVIPPGQMSIAVCIAITAN